MQHNFSSKAKLLRCSTFILLMSTLISACGSRVYSMMDTVDYALFGGDDVELTAQQIQQLPYAAQYARFADQPQALVMLAFIDNQQAAAPQYQWAAGQDDILLTQNGRMTGTRNIVDDTNVIKYDLQKLSSEQSDPLGCFRTHLVNPDTCPTQWQATAVIINDSGPQYFQLHSKITTYKDTRVALANGTEVNALVITEQLQVSAQQHQWSYTNQYWVAKDAGAGEFIKTSQQLVPYLPRLYTEAVKRIAQPSTFGAL